MIPFSIALISAATLGYEVLLIRLFSIIQWHHFAYMIISVALLGFGASGTFLALTRPWISNHFKTVYVVNAVLFGVTILSSFSLAQHVPFNPLEMAWDLSQQLYLLEIYLLLFLPFFLAANCIGLAFIRFSGEIGNLYRFNLMGSGIGALGIIAVQFIFFPGTCLRFLAGLGLAAGVLVFPFKKFRWLILLGWLAAIAVPVGWPSGWLNPRFSEYKALSAALRMPEARVVVNRSSPLGLVSVVSSPVVPLRYAPGLSLNADLETPDQLGIFIDGDALTVINRYRGETEPLAYLDYLTSALPYHLVKRPEVLILGAGGGMDVLQALYHQATLVDAVELNSQVAALVSDDYGDFSGSLYQRPEVNLHVEEGRGFLARRGKNYDLIQVALLDSFSASSAGVHALSESYLYTVEAMELFLHRLNPGGIAAITRWLKLPPRDSLKLFATALTTLERQGRGEPTQRLALIRSWRTSTLIVKNGSFSNMDIAAIRNFCRVRGFDVAYMPGITAGEADQYNLLQRPYFYEGAKALLDRGEREKFLENYKFNITPASDNRPYFFNFFKWRALPEFLTLRTRGGAALVEWGYLILTGTLIQATVVSLLLILLPLVVFRRRFQAGEGKRWAVAVYFLAIGFAFMFMEIAFIQKFILFLSHPLYAVAVVLAGFLLFAGLGSGTSKTMARILVSLSRSPDRRMPAVVSRSPVIIAAAGIGGISVLYLIGLGPLFRHLMPLADALKVVVSLMLIAPLAFLMGMPFPIGLSRVSEHFPNMIPWAWGINGCASVLATITATLVAVHFGFGVVTLGGTGLYLVSAAALIGIAAPDRR